MYSSSNVSRANSWKNQYAVQFVCVRTVRSVDVNTPNCFKEREREEKCFNKLEITK
jgi:hypothetical protein